MSGLRLLRHNLQPAISSSSTPLSQKFTGTRSISQSAILRKEDSVQKMEEVVVKHSTEFTAPSPYKNPGPRRYGYWSNYKTQGCLPRNDEPVKSLPKYEPKDQWTDEEALFGQNDYIDILGDGDVHPADLLVGPSWLVGFKGNERERLLRKMEWEGPRLKVMYPSEYNRMEKRIRYLTKLYNTKRRFEDRD